MAWIRVLDVQAGERAAQGVLLLLALFEGAQGPHEKVQVLVADGAASVWPASAVCAVECEGTVAFVDVGNIELGLHPLATEDPLVLAADPCDIVVEGERIDVEMRIGVGPAACGPFACGDLEAVCRHLIEVDTQGGSIDVVRRVATVVYAPHHCDVCSVYKAAA